MANETPTVLVFKTDNDLKEIEIIGERLVDKKTKEALARLKCYINFEKYFPEDKRGFTLYGCRLKELRKDDDGEIVGFTLDYDEKVYEDEEE